MSAACPLCESEPRDPPAHLRVPRLDLFAWCSACELAYAREMRHPGAEWYASFPSYAVPQEPSHDHRHEAFLRIAKGSIPGRLLDIGCGDGHFLLRAREHGWDPHGIDINPQAVERASARRGVASVAPADIDAKDFHVPWSKFDAITAFEVVEHLSDPLAAVRRMRGLLESSGICVITVPRLDRFPRRFHPSVDAPPHHLTLWTRRALTRLIEGAGFEAPRIVTPPLTARELYLHHLWRRHGLDLSRVDGGPLRGLPMKAALVAYVGLLRIAGMARGHTLVAAATA